MVSMVLESENCAVLECNFSILYLEQFNGYILPLK